MSFLLTVTSLCFDYQYLVHSMFSKLKFRLEFGKNSLDFGRKAIQERKIILVIAKFINSFSRFSLTHQSYVLRLIQINTEIWYISVQTWCYSVIYYFLIFLICQCSILNQSQILANEKKKITWVKKNKKTWICIKRIPFPCLKSNQN